MIPCHQGTQDRCAKRTRKYDRLKRILPVGPCVTGIPLTLDENTKMHSGLSGHVAGESDATSIPLQVCEGLSTQCYQVAY